MWVLYTFDVNLHETGGEDLQARTLDKQSRNSGA